MALSKAIFVDKDGTLIEDLPYNVDPARVALTPKAAEAMHALARAGYRVILVSNQPGIAFNKFDEQGLGRVFEKLRSLVPEVQAFYYCPHAPESGCGCRKPEPGLIERAAREHRVALADSWMIGDILDDVEAGRRAGCRTVLLDNGHETEWKRGALRRPDGVARDLAEAAALILRA